MNLKMQHFLKIFFSLLCQGQSPIMTSEILDRTYLCISYNCSKGKTCNTLPGERWHQLKHFWSSVSLFSYFLHVSLHLHFIWYYTVLVDITSTLSFLFCMTQCHRSKEQAILSQFQYNSDHKTRSCSFVKHMTTHISLSKLYD